MSNSFASTGRRNGRRLLLVLAISAAAIAAYALTPRSVHPSPGGRNDPLEHEGKRPEKGYTGLSFAKQTKVVGQASASATTTGFDSERVWSGNDDWEPTVALQPNSSTVYQLTTRYNGTKACTGCPFPVIVIRRSIDGGNTWQADHFIPTTKYQKNDPELQVADDGTLYLAWMDEYKPGVRFAKSTDGGSTWTTPLSLTPIKGTPNWSDKPLLLISPSGKDVYLGFNASDAYVASSHNYGASFGANVKVNNDTRYWFHTGGAVAPNGDVYFITSDFSQDYTGDANISLIKSTNGGSSWSIIRVDTSKQMPDCAWAAGCTLGFFGTVAGMAVDSAGKIMVAYNANNSPGTPMQLYARTSSNGGVLWSARMSIGGGGTVNHHSVQMVSGPAAGEFAVVWQDDRLGANVAWNVWLRHTLDSGTNWAAPVRLSDLGSGAPYKTANGYGFPYGDYLGVARDAVGIYHVVWGEGISYTGPGGTWYTKGH
jgi:hypothetical protein